MKDVAAVTGMMSIITFLVGFVNYLMGDLTTARIFMGVGVVCFVIAVAATPNRRYPK